MADRQLQDHQASSRGILYREAQPLYLVCYPRAYGMEEVKEQLENTVNNIMMPAMYAGRIC